MKKENLPMVIGILIPIVLVLGMFVYLFITTASIRPTQNFIYSDENQYGYGYEFKNSFDVQDSRLVLVSNETSPDSGYSKKETPELFLYDFEQNKSIKITLEEAKDFLIDDSNISEEGYEIKYDTGHDGILEIFGSNSDNDFYIYKDNSKKILRGVNSGRYRYEFKFIGWITN